MSRYTYLIKLQPHNSVFTPTEGLTAAHILVLICRHARVVRDGDIPTRRMRLRKGRGGERRERERKGNGEGERK